MTDAPHPIVAAVDAFDDTPPVDEASALADQQLLAQTRDHDLVEDYRNAVAFLDKLRDLGAYEPGLCARAQRDLGVCFARAIHLTGPYNA